MVYPNPEIALAAAGPIGWLVCGMLRSSRRRRCLATANIQPELQRRRLPGSHSKRSCPYSIALYQEQPWTI